MKHEQLPWWMRRGGLVAIPLGALAGACFAGWPGAAGGLLAQMAMLLWAGDFIAIAIRVVEGLVKEKPK